MRRNKRWISFILVFALTFQMSGFAYASETVETDEIIQSEENLAEISQINPIYEDLPEENLLAEVQHTEDLLLSSSSDYHSSVEAAGKEVRDNMVNRNESFDIYYSADLTDESSQSEWETIVANIINAALEHTGNPEEGDYLRWQYGAYSADIYKTDISSVYRIHINITYYTSKEQENNLSNLIDEAISSLDLDGKNDYQKIKIIYQYICSHVSYDYDHLSDADYMLQYTAYAAMVDEKAVCQGFALLLYRFLLEAGIDNRIIAGTAADIAHAWNITQIGSLYYNVDATWDEANEPSDYRNFLKSDLSFTNSGHIRDAEYATNAFYKSYPMSSDDYTESTEESYSEKGFQYIIYKNYAALIKADSTAGKTPVVPASVKGVPVTDIRKSAFSGMNIKTIDIPSSVTHIGASAFSGCKSLTDVYYNGDLSKWNQVSIESGNSYLQNAKIHCANFERLYGSDRYQTAMHIADAYKRQMGGASFSTIIVASGDNYPDALAGSYLAKVKKAPIVLVNKKNVSDIAAYIKSNTKKGGTVYLLGGEAVVPKSLETALAGNYTVKRLWGQTRYETNIAILNEAGATKGTVIVCTGNNFADSLSASATGYPILLVDNELKASQKSYLSKVKGSTFYYIGGPAVVSNKVASQIGSYAGSQKRVYGQTRYETSAKIANAFWGTQSKQAVLAYGQNYPDGLCGSTLCQTMNSPLLLVKNDQGSYTFALSYGNKAGLNGKIVLGGPTLISDSVAMKILRVKQ